MASLRMVLSLALICALVLLGGWSSSPLVSADLALMGDIKVLNYALLLERLENAFYVAGLAAFSATDFTTAGFDANLRPYLETVGAHEAAHVAFLVEAITAAGGTPVPACTYTFTSALASVSAFVTTAAALETGGQQAYDGAINGISNPGYAQAAATIATVEARHSAYLNRVTGLSPFPSAFDTASLPTVIAGIVGPFLADCPFEVAAALPGIRPSGVALDSSNNVITTGSLTPPSYSAAQRANDIVALNYALTLENLEAAFYADALERFPASAFVAAGLPLDYYNLSLVIAEHEAVHVATLGVVINGRSAGAAVPVCSYNFSSVQTVAQYVAVAQLLERTGVQAYDGAVNTITDTSLQQVAATIATVEARHAAILNLFTAASPFPDAFDTALTPSAVIAAVLATGFITSCPYTPVGPVVLPFVTESSSTGAMMSSSSSSGSMGSSSGRAGSSGSSGSSGSGVSGASARAASAVTAATLLAGVAALYAIVA